jgi:hypothetical protein
MYTVFLEHALQGLLESVPLTTRKRMHFQHDEVPPHISRHMTQYLNQQYPGHGTGRSSPQNWPPLSPDLNLLTSTCEVHESACVRKQGLIVLLSMRPHRDTHRIFTCSATKRARMCEEP